MKMFDWFKNKEYSNVVKFPEPKETPKTPYVVPPAPTPEPRKEHYRIGFEDSTQMVTLTLMSEYGTSMTLSMNPDACEKLIRMLRAAYPEDHNDLSQP
jgi:hypothetical protein